MKQILIKAAVATLFSIAASLVVLLMLGSAFGVAIETSSVVFTLLCPLVIAFPISFHLFRQREKLAVALEELNVVHGKLADAHALLAEKARYDGMTGLLNRETFFDVMDGMRRRSDTGVFLTIDVDHFKRINDTYGHHAGDEALALIAKAIAGGARDGDPVGRIGGEEFAVFLTGATTEEATIVAERIRRDVEAIRLSPVEGEIVPLSVSIGTAGLCIHRSWMEVLREADGRLYEAKRLGRNRVVAAGSAG